MKKNYFGIAIMVFGFIAMITIIYFLFFHEFSAPISGDIVATTTQTSEQPDTITIATIDDDAGTNVTPIKNEQSGKAITAEDAEKDEISALSKAFLERLGSFSSQSDFGNITDLEIFMTEKMRMWARQTVDSERAKKRDSEKYYGITTIVVGHDFVDYKFGNDSTSLTLHARRRESDGKTEDSYNQDAVIKVIKEDGVWRVDSVEWIDEKK